MGIMYVITAWDTTDLPNMLIHICLPSSAAGTPYHAITTKVIDGVVEIVKQNLLYDHEMSLTWSGGPCTNIIRWIV